MTEPRTESRTDRMSENAQAPASMPPFQDTPVKAAIRRAFDYPNIANLDALAHEAEAAGAEQARAAAYAEGQRAAYDHAMRIVAGWNAPTTQLDVLRALRDTPAPREGEEPAK